MKAYTLVLIALCFVGCDAKVTVQSTPTILVDANKELAKAYFRAGVSAAISTHFIWARDEILAGRNPSSSGAPDWGLEKAKAYWLKQFPQEELLK